MKIVADENIPLIHWFFDSLGEVITVPPRELNREHTESADILVVRSVVPIGRALLENTPVKFVGTCTAGVDHLDLPVLDELGIRWSSAPGCNAEAVVDYVFGVLAALEVNLSETSVGIIGCGNVGGRLFGRLDALGVECHCYDPLLRETQQPRLTSLGRVLESDVICIHAPLTTEGEHPSFHLLGAEQLRQLKTGATVISAGRGGVIDNRALSVLLRQREDLQVALDVWESEPNVDRTLFDQVTLGTPHIAGYSYDGKVRGTEMIYRELCRFLGVPATLSFDQLDSGGSDLVIEPDGADWQQIVRNAILAAYDPREDWERFRQALNTEASPGDAFDRLRKSYPVRREFSRHRLRLGDCTEWLEDKLLAVGFALEKRNR